MKKSSITVISSALSKRFAQEFKRKRVLFFCAPCGMGKTSAAHVLLHGKRAFFRSAADDDLLSGIPVDARIIVIDDFQLLCEPEDQRRLSDLIRFGEGKKFLFISRSEIPGWLVPFHLSGLLECFSTPDFLLRREDAKAMLESCGASVSFATLSAVERDVKG